MKNFKINKNRAIAIYTILFLLFCGYVVGLITMLNSGITLFMWCALTGFGLIGWIWLADIIIRWVRKNYHE